MSAASFTIALPPSLNNIFFNRPHGGRAKTTEYKAWRDAAAWEIRSQRVPFLAGEVSVDLVIERPNAVSDLDNRIKAALDAMQTAGVIKNDNQISEIRARWGAVVGCRVVVCSIKSAA